MPVHRSADEYPRRSRRLSRQGPKSYDEDGFELFDTVDCFRYHSEPVSAHTSVSSPSPPSPPPHRRSEPYPPTRTSQIKRKGNDHVPRPANAFIVFRSHWWSENKACPSVETDHREVSRIVAHHWNMLSEEERLPFRQEAEARKRQHAVQFPDYKYAPGTRKSVKPRKKVSRDSRAEKAKCDKIVGDYFLQKQESLNIEDPEIKRESYTPELVASPPPRSPSTNTSNDYELLYSHSPCLEEFVPTDDIPPLDLSLPDIKIEFEGKQSPFLVTNEFEQQPLSITYNTSWNPTTTESHLGSPVPITPFPSEISFDDIFGFCPPEVDFLWNSTPPAASPLFDHTVLASNISQSDYLLSCSNFFGTSTTSSDDTFDYDRFLNL
ncbi:hypothetical protein F5050DRAFT_1809804 [Lentinula boryana]|uniref:HMG box domain-containing protein n=1 Tax=Lentinula boryana TaxID=40481 RepID=A0ABQ8Q6S4_9AGAR|nr:hypothetical protein F5050DRAFT_1809804 [Lentinula boryana]